MEEEEGGGGAGSGMGARLRSAGEVRGGVVGEKSKEASGVLRGKAKNSNITIGKCTAIKKPQANSAARSNWAHHTPPAQKKTESPECWDGGKRRVI